MPKAQKAITKQVTSKNFLLARQELLYSHDEIKHFEDSNTIKKFLLRMADAEKNPCNNDNDINLCAAAWEFLMFNESRKLNKGANRITV